MCAHEPFFTDGSSHLHKGVFGAVDLRRMGVQNVRVFLLAPPLYRQATLSREGVRDLQGGCEHLFVEGNKVAPELLVSTPQTRRGVILEVFGVAPTTDRSDSPPVKRTRVCPEVFEIPTRSHVQGLFE